MKRHLIITEAHAVPRPIPADCSSAARVDASHEKNLGRKLFDLQGRSTVCSIALARREKMADNSNTRGARWWRGIFGPKVLEKLYVEGATQCPQRERH